MKLSQRTLNRNNYDDFVNWLNELGFSSNDELSLCDRTKVNLGIPSWLRVDKIPRHIPGNKARLEVHKFNPVKKGLDPTFEVRITKVE